MTMTLLTVLNWFTTKKAYLAPYADDESAKKAATKLWNSIDKGDPILFGAMIIIVLIACYVYFFPFNNVSGRHYHPKYWAITGVITLIVVFVSTYFGCSFIAKNASFDPGFIMKISAMNTFLSAIVFVVTSSIINRTGKSNAFPWI